MNQTTTHKNNFLIGVAFALTTVIIWSGNYVVAKGISKEIPAISLAFYRWLIASICIVPLAWKKFQADKAILLQHKQYLFWVTLTGIVIFNAFIYLAGHHTTAINLALIGTTAAPVFATVMAVVFLKEYISPLRIAGMVVCFAGVLFLLSQGSWEKLMHFHFSKGDILILISAFSFAIYNTLVRKKPVAISSMSFLMVTFIAGTIILFPAFLIEKANSPAVHFTATNFSIIAYLGIGNSVIGFLCWNASIGRIGASRTVIFANLIPILSTIESVLILGEEFTSTHLIAGIIIISGLVIANVRK
jgi:drug/metabolite transporter (DMT)-like permease